MSATGRGSPSARAQHQSSGQVATCRASAHHDLFGFPNIEQTSVDGEDVIKRSWLGMVGGHPIID
jgi:hypothetical protein